jgi:hypothetical protein
MQTAAFRYCVGACRWALGPSLGNEYLTPTLCLASCHTARREREGEGTGEITRNELHYGIWAMSGPGLGQGYYTYTCGQRIVPTDRHPFVACQYTLLLQSLLGCQKNVSLSLSLSLSRALSLSLPPPPFLSSPLVSLLSFLSSPLSRLSRALSLSVCQKFIQEVCQWVPVPGTGIFFSPVPVIARL